MKWFLWDGGLGSNLGSGSGLVLVSSRKFFWWTKQRFLVSESVLVSQAGVLVSGAGVLVSEERSRRLPPRPQRQRNHNSVASRLTRGGCRGA